MNIIDELKEAADMADTLGEAGDGNIYIAAIAEIQKLKTALEEIAEWSARYTSPGHPISVVARRALNDA